MINNAVLSRTIQLLKNGGEGGYTVGKYEQGKSGLVAVYTVRDIMDGIQGLGKSIYSGVKGIPNMVAQIKSTLTTMGYTALNGVLNAVKTAALGLSAVQTVVKIYRIARPIVENAVAVGGIMWNVVNITKIATDVLQYIGRLAVQTARTLLSRLWDNILSTPVIAVYHDENADGDEKNVDTSNIYEKASSAASDYMADDLSHMDNDNYSNIVQVMNTGSINGTTTGYLDKLYGLYTGWDERRSSIDVGYNVDLAFEHDVKDVYYNGDMYVLCEGGFFPTKDYLFNSDKTYYDASGNIVPNPTGNNLTSYYDKVDWTIFKGRDRVVYATIDASISGISKIFIVGSDLWYYTPGTMHKFGTEDTWDVTAIDYLYTADIDYVVASSKIYTVTGTLAMSLDANQTFTENGITYDSDTKQFYFLVMDSGVQKIVRTKSDFTDVDEILVVSDKAGLRYFNKSLWTWNSGTHKLERIDVEKGFNLLQLYKQTTDTEVQAGKTYYILSGNSYSKADPPNQADITSYYEATSDATIFNRDIRSNGYNVESVTFDINEPSITSTVISQTIPSHISSCTSKTYIVNAVQSLESLNRLTNIKPGDKYYVYDTGRYYAYQTIYKSAKATYVSAIPGLTKAEFDALGDSVPTGNTYLVTDWPISGSKTEPMVVKYTQGTPGTGTPVRVTGRVYSVNGVYWTYINGKWVQARLTTQLTFTFATNKSGAYYVRKYGFSDITSVMDRVYYYGNEWVDVGPGSVEDYLIATSGNNVLVSKKGETKWVVKNLDYNIEVIEDGNITSDYPESLDNFIGNLWSTYEMEEEGEEITADIWYLFSQNRIYSVTNIDSLLYGAAPYINVSLSPTIIEADSSDWTASADDESTGGGSNIKFDNYLDMPNNCIIQSCKLCTVDGEEGIYVGLYNTVYNVDKARQDNLTGKNIVFSGVYKMTRRADGTLSLASSPVFYTYGRKIYDFCYDGKNWYFSTVDDLAPETAEAQDIGDVVYRVSEFTEQDEDDIRAIESVHLSEGEYICSLDCVEDSNHIMHLLIFCNDGVKVQEASIQTNDATTKLKIKTGDKAFYSTRNVLMIKDDDRVYNVVNINPDIPDDVYQCAYETQNSLRLFQSKDSVFICDNGNTLKLVPVFNSYMISSNWGCGYLTDTTLHNWKGIAPYYFVSNAMNMDGNGKGIENRSRFLQMFMPSWRAEFKKFLAYSADAFIKYSHQEILLYLAELNFQLEGDTDGRLVDEINKLVAEATSLEVGMYAAQQFETRMNQEATIESFVNDLYALCLSDGENDMTDDFYKVALMYFYNILKEGMMAYYAASSYEGRTGYTGFTEPTDSGMGYTGIISTGSPPSGGTGLFGDSDEVYGSFEYWLLRYYQVHKVEWYTQIMTGISQDLVNYNVYSINVETPEFIEADNAYRMLFYNDLLEKADDISGTVSQARLQALSIVRDYINDGTYKTEPVDNWRLAIKGAVADYKNAQEEQYIAIVRASSMDPIQWNELPPKINRETFTYALNMLLDLIKERIIENIIILITSTQGVLCYSCLDSNTIAEKILEASRKYYKNQLRSLYKTLQMKDYTSVDQIKAEFNLLGKVGGTYAKPYSNLTVNSGDELHKTLDKQTRLYAEYTNKIAYEQVVNNNSEVEYND